jgi:hypothetical protein
MSGIFRNCPICTEFTSILIYTWSTIFNMQLLCFWTLSVVLFIYKTQRFEDWILSPSSGKNYSYGNRIQSRKRCVLSKNRTMDNVQKHNHCINIPSSHLCAFYLVHLLFYALDLYILGHFKLSVLMLQKSD